MGCGKESGGNKKDDQGVCPAAKPNSYNGANNGKYAGRFCWAVMSTQCNGKIQGAYAKKFLDCVNCDFFKKVQDEEGNEFILSPKVYKEIDR